MVREQKSKPPHTPKAKSVVGVARVVAVATGAAREVGVVVPAAASQNTDAQNSARSSRVRCRRSAVAPIPIPAPFRHVASHVIQAISVRRKVTHRTGVGVEARLEARMVALRRADVVGDRKGAVVVRPAVRDRVPPRKPLPAGSAPRCLLPFRLRRQPVAAAPLYPIVLHVHLPRAIHRGPRRTSVIRRHQPRFL